jgi:hypothetical protein
MRTDPARAGPEGLAIQRSAMQEVDEVGVAPLNAALAREGASDECGCTSVGEEFVAADYGGRIGRMHPVLWSCAAQKVDRPARWQCSYYEMSKHYLKFQINCGKLAAPY